MGFGDTIISFIRTYVPVYVGTALTALSTWLFNHHVLFVRIDTQAGTLWAVSVVIGAYYALARLLESKWPRLGFLLGKASTPMYPTTRIGQPGPANSWGTGPMQPPS